ncbi:MAG TPA: hypothetical protein VMY69_03755, partial [Phycisphaerae bacterium]|nr:hypothetical protein [Phycisphaerae bacterium]
LPTHHKKIFVWQSRPCTPEFVDAALERLQTATNSASLEEVQKTLQSVVPEFQPSPNGGPGGSRPVSIHSGGSAPSQPKA